MSEYHINHEQDMTCECGKKMIKRSSNIVLTSYPPQYPWYWWCGCGKTREGGVTRGTTEAEIAQRDWERKNSGESHAL